MRAVEKAYIAGFLDGDGSVMATIEPHPEMRFGYRVRVMVKFSQSWENKSILSMMKRLIGTGYISSSREGSEYVIKQREYVKRLLVAIQPYVVSKRKQIDLAFKILAQKNPCTKRDLMKVSRMADQIAKCNIRSRSRRKNNAAMIRAHLFPRNDSRC